jgi:hypothetical protein
LDRNKWFVLLSFLFLCLFFLTASSQAQIDDATRKLSYDIFKQLIEINSTDSVGSVTAASEAMAQRFRDAGFTEGDIQISAPMIAKRMWSCACMGAENTNPFC